MPSPKINRKGSNEKNKKGRLSEKASSFHEKNGGVVAEMLPRPRTVPELLVRKNDIVSSTELVLAQGKPALTKLLLNVTIQRSLGAVQVLMSPDATVDHLITAALRQYAKEGRRPIISSADSSGFDLHYSQFSLESNDSLAVFIYSRRIFNLSLNRLIYDLFQRKCQP
ncbi:uncharacterized protein LOC111379920 [Olea europaea var. sylvestris]|uniref:uncharacterized protein LOC111379920 n=1 Tax=Olea europaea var. sylvestris TaxID=158386 RepID=UPI000C1D2E22|nr:uncharacterized protein LOC111379920 [Olea europaea var. sylvestris]